MKALKTNIAERLQAAIPPAIKTGAQALPGLDGFLSKLKSELTMPETPANAAALEAGAKKKAAAATADGVADSKSKSKHPLKTTSEHGLAVDAKTADGAVSAGDITAIAVPVSAAPSDLQPVQVASKELGDAKVGLTNSASTSTLQQAPLLVDMLAGPVEIAAVKQADASALEGKTKRVSVSAIAALSDKPAAGSVSADGSQVGTGANGMLVGGVAGQAMQGGQSSGSSGHHGQATPSHPAAGAGPQVVASSPAQLDVGVYDDTHGWLRIRAELGAGGAVNASLTSADAAHESLKTALPAMTHYLGTESVQVNSIELHKFGDHSGGQPGANADSQQQGSMAGQHARGDEQQQASAQANVMAALDDAASRSAAASSEASDSVEAVGAVSAVAASPVIDAVSESSGAVLDIASVAQPGSDGQMPDLLGAHGLPWQVGYGGSGGWVNVSA